MRFVQFVDGSAFEIPVSFWITNYSILLKWTYSIWSFEAFNCRVGALIIDFNE